MKRAGPGWLLLALAGLASVFGAFLPFYTYATGVDVTVWSRGLFPTAALIPLLGVCVGVEAVFVMVRGREPRSPFFNFSWEQARLAVGAFMILLTLSYLVQDRAGGSLGIGYALLAVSSLATFGGGVLTRRAQLARAPGGEVAEHRPVIRPALASVSRASSDLVKNVSGRSRDMRVRLAERREARAAARKDAAEKAAARRAEMQAVAEKEAAERAAVERAAAEKAAAEKAAADKVAAEKAAAEKAAAAKAAAEKEAEDKVAAAKAAADKAAAAMAAAEKEAEDKAAAAKAAADEAAAAMAAAKAAHQPAPPTATVESLPAASHPPPPETVEELPADDPAEQPPPPAATVEEPAAEPAAAADEPDDTAELPVTEPAPAADDETVEQPRVAKLSAVPSETEPDPTPPPDGESPNLADEEEEEKERADTGTEGSPSS